MHDMMDRLSRVEAWMVDYIAELLEVPASDVPTDRSFDQLGLDSVASVTLVSDLGRWMGLKLDTRLVVEHPTIEAVAAHLRRSEGRAAAV